MTHIVDPMEVSLGMSSVVEEARKALSSAVLGLGEYRPESGHWMKVVLETRLGDIEVECSVIDDIPVARVTYSLEIQQETIAYVNAYITPLSVYFVPLSAAHIPAAVVFSTLYEKTCELPTNDRKGHLPRLEPFLSDGQLLQKDWLALEMLDALDSLTLESHHEREMIHDNDY